MCVSVYIYCHTSLKPYYCFCELRIVIERHTDTQSGKDRELKWKKNEKEIHSHTTSDETDLHSKTYAQCWTFNAMPNLNYSNHTIRCVYLILIHTQREWERLDGMAWDTVCMYRHTKRRHFDGITNEKANNNIRLMSLFFSFYWHTEYNSIDMW